MRIVFTGGGTGGHVYPNIAIYEIIKEKYPDASFLYIGNKKGAESRVVKAIPQPIDFVAVPSRGIPERIKSFKTLIALLYIFLGTIKSFFILRRFKPDLIVGSGGYVAAPVLFAASFLKLKVFIHEQNAVPGRLNRFVARFASKIGVSFSSTARFFPEEKVVVTGYPLRRSIRLSSDKNAREKYSIPAKNKVIFVFGGSGGAQTINNAVAEIIPSLLSIPDLTIILATGRGYSNEYKAYDDTLKVLQSIDIPSELKGRLIVGEYFDNIDEIYSISDLIVSRAGAGTIKEITTLGLPSILVPKINLPGDHQILNAREVEKIGGAHIVYESVAYKNNQRSIYVPEQVLLKKIKEILFDDDALFNMRKNLRQVEKQNSTDMILQVLEQLIKGKEKSEETRIKIFYFQAQESEKNIEMVFDDTTIGNSFLCDYYLDNVDKDVLVEIKVLEKGDKIVARRVRGHVSVNEQPVENWTEIAEGSHLQIENKTFELKSYYEKFEKINLEKSTSAKVLGSSLGIFISRFGGLFRNIFIAAYFGASKATDIFAIGLSISTLMRRIVAENALENAFLPIFSRLFHRTSRKKTWEAASSIVNFTILASLIITVILLVFTGPIIKSLFPSFAERGMTTEAIQLTRLIIPYLFLVTIASIMTTYLKSFNRFGLAETSAIFFSVGIVFSVVFLSPSTGVYSLGYGTLIGGFLQIIFLLPFLYNIFKHKSLQFSYKPVIHFSSPVNKKYYAQLGPISLDVILAKISEVVGKVLAGRLHDGAISVLNYSQIIFQLPFAIVSQAINNVVLKEYSDHVALFDRKKARRLFIDGIRINMFLLIPLSVLMFMLAKPIIYVILKRGTFKISDMIDTAYALQFWAIGLVGWGVHSLTVRIFSARMDIKTSMVLNFFMLMSNVGLCLWWVQTELSFAGLALATSVSFLVFSLIRVMVLKRKLEREDIWVKYKDFGVPFFKIMVSTFFMIVVLVAAQSVFERLQLDRTFFGNLALLISLSFIGISVYILSSLLLKNTEMWIFKKKRVKRVSEAPVSMLSPFKFLEHVSKKPELYKEDFFYKINIYTSSPAWEVRNIGIKLIGLFNDTEKIHYLEEVLRSGKENGFVMRNAVQSLRMLNTWSPALKQLTLDLMKHGYYEVRAAAIDYLAKCGRPSDYPEFKNILMQSRHFRKATLQEQLSILKLMAKMGGKDDLLILEDYFLCSNSLVREEILEVLYSYYRRKILTGEEVKDHIKRVLITSNNFNPEFKLKMIIKKIHKEIE